MNTPDIELPPEPVFEMAECLADVSRAGIQDFVQLCRKDKTTSRHMLVPGDCRDTLTLLPAESVQLVVTSIPYGDYVNYAKDGLSEGSSLASEIGSEESFLAYLQSLKLVFKEVYRVVANSGVVAVNLVTLSPGGRGDPGPNGIKNQSSRFRRKGRGWTDQKRAYREKDTIPLPDIVARIARRIGFYTRQVEIVHKRHCRPESVRDRSRRTHEYVLILTKTRNYNLDRLKLSAEGMPCDESVFQIPVAQATYGHPATFHPYLPERYIVAASSEGDVVLDFTAGAGTTALAALKHNRHSISLELYTAYLETARDRLASFGCSHSGRVLWAPSLGGDSVSRNPGSTEASPGFRPHDSDVRFMNDYRTIRCPEAALRIQHSQPAGVRAFPLNCLAPFQGRMVEELARVYQVDPDILAPTCLGVWAGCLGNRWVTHGGVPGRTTHANIHTIVAVPHGTGKGCGDMMAAPMVRYEELATKLAIRRGSPAPSFTADSATGAAIVEALKSGDESLLLYSSEAGGLLIDLITASRGGSGGLFDLLLRGYSVQPLKEQRISRGQYRGKPCIGLLWLAQPHLAHQLVGNPQFSERGLASRWLFVEREGRGPQFDDGAPVRPNDIVLNAWDRALRKVLAPRITGRRGRREHTWSGAAQDVFRMHHNRVVALQREEWKHHQRLFDRSRENAIRIAVGLLAADIVSGLSFRGDEDAAIAERAVAIMDWFEHERFLFFARRDEDRLSSLKNRVLECLVLQAGSMTLRDLHRRHGVEDVEAQELVRVFPELFSIRREKKSTGRPSKVLELKSRAAV